MRSKRIWALAVAFGLTSGLSVSSHPLQAQAASMPIASQEAGTTYSGDLQNGLPQGKGKLEWGSNKWYVGEFMQGKRSGSGKYFNEYVDKDGQKHRLVYNGSWNHDQMNGPGTRTEQVTDASGQFLLNKIETGAFVDNAWASGYNVYKILGDPDHSFVFKGNGMTLSIWGTAGNLLEKWKAGELFRVQYQKVSVYKEYWQDPEENPAKEKARQTSIHYLQGITKQVVPYLEQFEQLAKQVPFPK